MDAAVDDGRSRRVSMTLLDRTKVKSPASFLPRYRERKIVPYFRETGGDRKRISRHRRWSMSCQLIHNVKLLRNFVRRVPLETVQLLFTATVCYWIRIQIVVGWWTAPTSMDDTYNVSEALVSKVLLASCLEKEQYCRRLLACLIDDHPLERSMIGITL